MTFLYRDTDKDWQKLGKDNPYWGVLTAPQFQSDVITDEGIEQFYGTGHTHIEWLNQHIAKHFGEELKAEKALDFGCGVGRITLAMTGLAKEVVGVDISAGMLEKARARSVDSVRFLHEIPEEDFDWIHSFIVFQHIPPPRGIAIFKNMLRRLKPGGWITVHFTVDREAIHKARTPGAKLVAWLMSFKHPEGVINMYDYDLGTIVSDLYWAGVPDLSIVTTDHGGHIGAFIVGRKLLNDGAA